MRSGSQVALLVATNVFVGAMVGVERATLSVVAEQDFGLASTAAALSFLVTFGLAKALVNLVAGAAADRLGRRRVLLAGWLLALPVPFAVLAAPSWGWVVAANA
ncbi:MAG TPA: MFS transporter, partial [Candidatus Thermoplasmatota archaeon]|nr:MFS transporter [Candidatus Thermoplasmatota archaeon]